MTLVGDGAKVAGKIAGPASARGHVPHQSHNADNTLATFRFKLKDVKCSPLKEAFKAEERGFAAGLVHRQDGGQSGRPAHAGWRASRAGL